jgi:hypothetical protein
MELVAIESHSRQRREALARANLVRLVRAKLKRRIAQGEVSAAEVILVSRWEVEGMSIAELLTSQRQWGEARCRRALMPLHIHGNKTIGSMTERQRVALGALLTRHPQPDRLCGNDAAAKRR